VSLKRIVLCFKGLHSTLQAEDREFLLRVSYMEIYNEEINDLLAPENRKLQVHENIEVCFELFFKFLIAKMAQGSSIYHMVLLMQLSIVSLRYRRVPVLLR
jgi:hypothetical protein